VYGLEYGPPPPHEFLKSGLGVLTMIDVKSEWRFKKSGPCMDSLEPTCGVKSFALKGKGSK